MGIAKKGTRKIIVDEISYRWVVSPDDEPGLGIIVEKHDNPGQRLTIYVPHGTIISPGLVRKIILYGIDIGWNPSETGKPIKDSFF